MNNKIRYIILFVILLSQFSAFSHTTITLKNGSVIVGDIVVQRPGQDMTVDAENATFVINPGEIVGRNTKNVKYDDLSRQWKRWVLENKALKGDAYGRFAEMSDIKTKDYTFPAVMNKPENGRPSNIYEQENPTKITIHWGDVSVISKNTGSEKYNLVDEIITGNGKIYEGRIISQRPGEYLTINTGSNQINVKSQEIREIRKRKPKNAGSYFDRIDYVNVIKLNDGKEKEGLIVVNHYGSKTKDNYIKLLLKNGKEEKILYTDIAEFITKYQSNPSPAYMPEKVYVNEFKIEKASMRHQGGDIVCIDKTVFPFPEGLNIEFKSDGKSFTKGWSLVPLSEIVLDNGRTSWGYNPDTLAQNTVRPKSHDTINSVSSIKFGYLSPGYYALVNDSGDEHYIFKITK